MTAIYLIRHGKTIANEQRLYCGATDLPLSPDGAREIARLKEQGIYPPSVDVCVTSGLARAQQTLDVIYGDVPRTVLSALAEYNFGQFEMKGYEQLKDLDDYRAWVSDQTEAASCPGGESKGEFSRRVLAGYSLLEQKAREHGNVLAVCHGGVIACIMEHLLPGEQNFYEWQPQSGRGYVIVRQPDGVCRYEKI